MHVVAVSFGEPLRDELADDPLELPVDELDTLRAVRVDVPGDELPVKHGRRSPPLPQLYRQLAIGTLAPVQQKGDDPLLETDQGRLAMPRVTVNGTELYYEIRGTGPPVLLIMGATGDGGHFDALADVLADEFTVVSYDRRGNGRSPVPAGWQTTSPEEQADDAAALLDALGIGPAAVFGTSSGGIFALCLMVRHPESVRGAILHEPGLYALVDDFDAVRAPLRAVVAGGDGGRWAVRRRGALLVLRGRTTTAGTGYRLRFVSACAPPPARCSRSSSGPTSCTCPTSRRWPRFPRRCACSSAKTACPSRRDRRPARRAPGRRCRHHAGTHDAYHDHPCELAESIRPFLREVSFG